MLAMTTTDGKQYCIKYYSNKQASCCMCRTAQHRHQPLWNEENDQQGSRAAT
jgi:hypothetical protein